MSRLTLTELLRRFEEVYSTQKGLPWIGVVRPEQAFAEAATQLEAMQAEIDRLRNFVEEIAGSCIPDYEEAKAEAQGLLGMANADYVSDTPRTDRFGRRLRTIEEARASLHGQEQ